MSVKRGKVLSFKHLDVARTTQLVMARVLSVSGLVAIG